MAEGGVGRDARDGSTAEGQAAPGLELRVAPGLSRTVALAWSNLRSHPLRSLLSALGIVFGVASVVAMVTIGAGARREALELLSRLGLENVYLLADPVEGDGSPESAPLLATRDVEAVARTLPACTGGHAFARTRPELIAAGGRTAEGLAVGAERGFLDAVGLEAGRGRLWRDELDARTSVCVLGPRLAERLFRSGNAIGRDLRVDVAVCRVIGVLAPSGQLALGGTGQSAQIDPADAVFLPLEPFRALPRPEGAPEIDGAVLTFASAEATRGIAEPIVRMLARLHGGAREVRVLVPEALVREQQRTRRVFTVVMTAIAAISLLVGGVGITNVMLTSVLERTPEIGVQRAVGATERDIRDVFLAETAVLCLAGGVLGVLLGFVIAGVVARFAGWPIAFSLTGTLLALLLAGGVGLAAGLWPAQRAARLDPIEAIRSS